MNSKFTFYVCDVETTGIDYLKNDIIELALHRVNDDVSKTWHIKAINIDNIDQPALRINGHKLEDILHKTAEGKEKYREPLKVLAEIENFMMEDGVSSEERILVGQNIQFDLRFLQKLWERNNMKETFPFGPRPYVQDTMQLAIFLDIVFGEESQYYNLGSLVEKYGVKKLKSHRAEQDCTMTRDVYLKQIEKIQKLLKK
jgi:DNA polymerase III alpha subunit (gram-positive type)